MARTTKLTPALPNALTVLSFTEVARRVRAMYGEQRLSHQEIAEKMREENIAPLLGHEEWSWRLADSVLVLSTSQRHAHTQDPPA